MGGRERIYDDDIEISQYLYIVWWLPLIRILVLHLGRMALLSCKWYKTSILCKLVPFRWWSMGVIIDNRIIFQDLWKFGNKYNILPFPLKVVRGLGIWWNGRRKLLKYEDFQEPYKIFQWFLCFGPRILVSYWVWTFPVTTDTNIFCHWNIFYIPGATNDMIDRCLQPNEISSNKIRLQIWSLFNLKKFISKIEKSY